MFWRELAERDPLYVLEMSRIQVAITQKAIQESQTRIRKGRQSRRERSYSHLSPPDRQYMDLRRWLEQNS